MLVIHGLVLSAHALAVACAPAMLKQDCQKNQVSNYDFPFTTRAQWQARPPKQKLLLPSPVPYVVIHHSYIPPVCRTREQCRQSMTAMQNFHMDDRNWWDIGYHFVVGGDGVAYEGRGWGVLGAHAFHFNNVSIGICLIGDWSNSVPSIQQLKTAQALIAAGVEMGYIKSDYKLVGHRQVRDTECPGNALFNEIQNWVHYSPFPSSEKDLPKVIELSGLS